MYGERDNGAQSDVRFHTLKQAKLYKGRTFLSFLLNDKQKLGLVSQRQS